MSAEMILNQFSALGLSATIRGERLVVRPKERLTDELRRAIRDHKPDLIRLLSETTTTHKEGPPYPDDHGRVKCVCCLRCEVTGTRAICGRTKREITEIALLTKCPHFIMRELHWKGRGIGQARSM